MPTHHKNNPQEFTQDLRQYIDRYKEVGTPYRNRSKWASEHERYNRFTPIMHVVFKEFNENYMTIRKTLPMICAVSENCDGEAVEWAAKRLDRRKENRKILMVLSDGCPSIGISTGRQLSSHLESVVKKAEDSGIEVIGIGILSQYVENFYKTHTVIEKIEQISSKIYSVLLEKLRNKRMK